MNNINEKPADSLMELDLDDGWKVKELIKKTPAQTGGTFSSGYIVENNKGEKAFLKAMDFSSALQSKDFTKSLENCLKAYNFEREMLYKCKNKHLSKIIMPITHGSVNAPGFPPLINKVPYIIFELASGDIRKAISESESFDIAFCLRSLHNTAVGIEQLHKNGIAHQDLKPSNILVTKNMESKISDLGRCSDKETPFFYDKVQIPGDPNYAPFEQIYNYHFSNDFTEKYAADMYHFGSIFFFFFTKTSARQATTAHILKNASKNFQMSIFLKDLPIIEQGFFDALIELKDFIKNILPKNYEEIIFLVKALCEPDPEKRGHPINIKMELKQYSLERFISHLNILARKAEYGIR